MNANLGDRRGIPQMSHYGPPISLETRRQNLADACKNVRIHGRIKPDLSPEELKNKMKHMSLRVSKNIFPNLIIEKPKKRYRKSKEASSSSYEDEEEFYVYRSESDNESTDFEMTNIDDFENYHSSSESIEKPEDTFSETFLPHFLCEVELNTEPDSMEDQDTPRPNSAIMLSRIREMRARCTKAMEFGAPKNAYQVLVDAFSPNQVSNFGVANAVLPGQGVQSAQLLALMKEDNLNEHPMQNVKRYNQFRDTRTEKSRVNKLISLQFKKAQKQFELNNIVKSKLVNAKDMVLTISLFCTGLPDIDPSCLVMPDEARKLAEIEILGTNTIGDLVDMFRCEHDLVCSKAFKVTSDVTKIVDGARYYEQFLAKNISPNFALFIGDICFSREPLPANFMELLGRLKTELMFPRTHDFIPNHNLNTQLKDLVVRFGFPYAYIHQDNCEHILAINHARLPRQNDLTESFPRYIKVDKSSFKLEKCYMDRRRTATWVLTDCPKLPVSTAFLCSECIKLIFKDLTVTVKSRTIKRKKIEGDKCNEHLGYIWPYYQPCDLYF